MVGAILATIVALIALWRLDQLDGHRMRRWIPANWRTFTLADATVMFGFVLWWVIGANSSDDGYILGMARVADRAGYMSNYFRWFGSPEDPFGWYYNLLALMTHVSDSSLWIRLPDLVAGIACWLLLSKEVLPRLGPAVTKSKPANWAAGLVLLTAWMPFDNGLRPEPIIAVGSLITYVLIERSMRYSRLTPAALAVVTAAFTLGVQPTGLIAVARVGGRWSSDPANLGATSSRGRHLAVGGADAGGRHGDPDRGVRRPDAGNGVGGHQDSYRDRPQPGLVHREPALLLPDPAHRRRFAVAPVRFPDHRAVPVHHGVHHVAAQAGSAVWPAGRRGG